jgi:hypothetical protein
MRRQLLAGHHPQRDPPYASVHPAGQRLLTTDGGIRGKPGLEHPWGNVGHRRCRVGLREGQCDRSQATAAAKTRLVDSSQTSGRSGATGKRFTPGAQRNA